ncbi:hypothetical protein Tco_1132295 [Tanacetum coccineum]|uniref:Uncharacterized protein n=1 Tax=Tanacetum coccineum TaxID=301880 RepID=A0ABQ5JFM1_9ASTR
MENEGSGGNHGGQSSNDASLSGNEDGQEAKERSQTTYRTSQSLDKECCTEDKIGKEDVSKEKGVHKDLAFEDLDDFVDVDDTLDYIETEDDQDMVRTSSVVLEEKESTGKGVSTEAPVSTDKQDRDIDNTKVSTDRQVEGTADQNKGKSAAPTAPTVTSTPTLMVFGDDETIGQVLIIMSQNKEKIKEKEKGVKNRNVEDTERPRPTSTRFVLTLKPLPKIDPKDKGKKRIEEEDESDTESEDITKAEKKFKQLANDEEVARKVQEEWEAEEEKKRLDEEEATKAALSNEYDFIQARLNADKILAEKLQEEERERSIRNKPPSRNQLRNQMMTYLKHVGGKNHYDLKTKSFDEIQVLYEKIKRSDDSFIAIGSAEDEKMIKEMNEQAADASKKRVKKDDSVKGEIKEEEGTRKRKLGKRKKMKSKKRKFTSKDDEELRLCLTIAPDEDKEVDYEILDKKYPIIEWRSEYLTTKPQYDETEEVEDVYLNVVIRSNRQRRYFSTLMAVLSILDRDDMIHSLVMKRFETTPPEGIDLLLWGDLRTMFESKEDDELWKNQEEWKLQSWIFYENCGVHVLRLEDGTEINMLAERRYPITKHTLERMMDLRLTVVFDDDIVFDLLRFIVQQIDELRPRWSEEGSLSVGFKTTQQMVIKLAIPEQTTTGKGISNPLMAGSLPKTTKPT